MQWTARPPFVPPALLDRLDRVRLRRAALQYAAHGWAVTPGARLTGHRFTCGRPGCPIMTCHPALESWEESASSDLARVAEWWRHLPYTVLLATGYRFDVLEVPAALGLRALGAIRLHTDVAGPGRSQVRGPVAVTAGGRWMFLVRPGEPLCSELDHRLDIVRHGRGSWIPVAPTSMPEGAVRWAVAPDQVQWHLPAAAAVQATLVDALGAVRTVREPQIAVPRQMSTLRRAA